MQVKETGEETQMWCGAHISTEARRTDKKKQADEFYGAHTVRILTVNTVTNLCT